MKTYFLIHANFVTIILISLFYCCEKFNETSLPEKDFYSHLNMEDNSDADYTHGKRVCKDFEIKNEGECHNLYVQSDTLLLVDVLKYENFRNMS